MNPYSHIVIASKLEQQVVPENIQEYYWGAVAPDARHLAGIQRHQTHISHQEIGEFIAQYPHLKSFLQGYLIHCLSDEIPLEEVFYQHFPFSILKGKLSWRHLAVILEFFYLENAKIKKEVSGSYNEVLNRLGLSESDCAKYTRFVRQYMASASFNASIADLTRLLGLENDKRIDKYVSTAEKFQKNWLLKNILVLGIQAGKIDEKLVFRVSSMLKTMQCC
jgi:hypothetical protein